MDTRIFGHFPPQSKEDWIQQAIQDIKRKDFEDTLSHINPDGIQIFPFYTKEDADYTGVLRGYHNALQPRSDIPGLPPRTWANVCEFEVLDEKASNQEILHSLMNGADGLLLKVSRNTDWDVLLRKISLPYLHLFLYPVGTASEVWDSFREWISTQDIEKSALQGAFVWDGCVAAFQEPTIRENLTSQAQHLLEAGRSFPNFKMMAMNLAHYHQCGATAVQELGYGFSGWLGVLDELIQTGIPAAEIFGNTMLHLEAGADFFGEISKIRAARIMFHQLARLYSVDIDPAEIRVFVTTSFWTKSTWDVQTNMLRNTSEAMAAILGGCNSLRVRTHDFGNDEFGRRMARNISNILIEEACFDKVLDPVAGNYYLETLVLEILENTKTLLLEIESKGSWWAAFEMLEIQQAIRITRNKRMRAILEDKSTKIGVNKYAVEKNSTFEQLPLEEPWQLLPWRETMLVENQNASKP